MTRYIQRRSRGVTLVESVVGMALLGTVLVSILVADGRLARSARLSQQRLEACEIADRMLHDIWAHRSEFLRKGGGGVPRRSGWRWRAVPRNDSGATRCGGELYLLEIMPPRSDKVVASLEMVLPVEGGME